MCVAPVVLVVVLVLDLSTSLAVGAIPASTEVEDANDDDDDGSGGTNAALITYQGLPWVSRNKRFVLTLLEMCTRSRSKVRSRFSPYPVAPSGLTQLGGGGLTKARVGCRGAVRFG